MRREFKGFFVIKQIEKPWLCSVLMKRTQDAVRARKKCSEEHETWSSVSPHFLNVSQQNIEQLGLLYLLNRESKRQGTRETRSVTRISRKPRAYLRWPEYYSWLVTFTNQTIFAAVEFYFQSSNWPIKWDHWDSIGRETWPRKFIVEFYVLGLNTHVGWLTLAHEMTNLKSNIFSKNTFV